MALTPQGCFIAEKLWAAKLFATRLCEFGSLDFCCSNIQLEDEIFSAVEEKATGALFRIRSSSRIDFQAEALKAPSETSREPLVYIYADNYTNSLKKAYLYNCTYKNLSPCEGT